MPPKYKVNILPVPEPATTPQQLCSAIDAMAFCNSSVDALFPDFIWHLRTTNLFLRRHLGKCLYCAVGKHGVGHLNKAADVGTLHVVYPTVAVVAVLHTLAVDVPHDATQTTVHFAMIPREP